VPHAARRPAFTLLEVLLATAIGVLLMAGLYVAVDVQLKHAQAGRDLVEHSTLVRALFARIVTDLTPTLAPTIPLPASSSGGGGGATGAAASTTTTTTPASGTGTTDSSASTNQTTPTAIMGSVPIYNVGVQGEPTRLVLAMSRLPREVDFAMNASADPENLPLVCDIRRISYWLIDGGEMPLGLARQELKLVASDDLMAALPPDIPDELSHLMAEEVKSLTFSYWDGSAWSDTWDSTQVGADGVTPLGPPQGIAIVVGIATPGARGASNLKTYRHFIRLPTANGLPSQTQTTGTTSP
jgi:prepilin-type N-terminal cleavage/methylation domain-containing protein